MHRLCAALSLAIAAPAAAQQAAYVAETRTDVNGDTRIDVIRVLPNGHLQVLITGGSDHTIQLRGHGRPRSGTLQVASGAGFGGQTVIVAQATFAGSRGKNSRNWAAVAVWHRGTLHEVMQHPIGPQGRDGEWERRLELTQSRLLLYQFRTDIQRCDGKTAYLFPKAYDWRQRIFRPVSNFVRIPATAPVLTAQSPPRQISGPPAVFRATSVSATDAASRADELVAPRAIDDGNMATAWTEQLGGYGRGEFITARARTAGTNVQGVTIVSGHGETAATFSRHSRLRRAALLVGSKIAYWLEFPNTKRATRHWFALPRPVETACVTVIVDDVYGSPTGTTAISEFAVVTDVELTKTGVHTHFATVIANGLRGAKAALQSLRSQPQRGARALLEQLRTNDRRKRGRVVRALAMLGHPLAAAPLAAALAKPASRANRRLISNALVAIGDPAVPHLAAALTAANKSPPSARASIISTLGRIASEPALRALIQASRSATHPTVRRALGKALGQRPPGDAAILLKELDRPDAAVEPELWRALGMLQTKPLESAIGAQLNAALIARLRTARRYELRTRMFETAAASRDASVHAQLTQILATLDDSPQQTALRRVIASHLHADHRDTLLKLAADRDPGVRIAALRSLATATPPAPLPVALNTAKLDPWTEVRIAAIDTIAPLCTRRDVVPTLKQVALHDTSAKVVKRSLSALVGCTASGLAALALSIVNGNRALAIRVAAASFLGAVVDKRITKQLVASFTKQRRAAWNQRAKLRLAIALASALAHYPGAEVVTALVRAAREPAFPRLQTAAVAALGGHCTPPALRALRRAARAPERGLRFTAKRALARCRA